MKKVKWRDVKQKIDANAFKEKGILYNFDLVKNEVNPEDGHIIDFTNEAVKKGVAELFRLKGNKVRSRKIEKYAERYPEVKNYLNKICSW